MNVFAFAVSTEGDGYSSSNLAPVFITVTDDLTISVPATETQPAIYIDVPLKNVGSAILFLGRTCSQSNDIKALVPPILQIKLNDSASPAYCVNESERSPSNINLVFNAVEDAKLVARHAGVVEPLVEQAPNGSGSYLADTIMSGSEHVKPFISQSQLIDVSEEPIDDRSTGRVDSNVSEIDSTGPDDRSQEPGNPNHKLASLHEDRSCLIETTDIFSRGAVAANVAKKRTKLISITQSRADTSQEDEIEVDPLDEFNFGIITSNR